MTYKPIIETYTDRYPGELHITRFYIHPETKIIVLSQKWILNQEDETIFYKKTDHVDPTNNVFKINEPYIRHEDGLHYYHQDQPKLLHVIQQ